MSLFPVVHITPIILPQLVFKDKFNSPNAYFDMNPSLYISENGSVIILVRRVNYRKYFDKQFVLYEEKSNSIYSILRGNITDSPLNINDFTIKTIENNYSMPIYNTYWTGVEDIRFINETNILATIPEGNPNGNPCIFHASLNDNKLHVQQMCKPNNIEKNWMPYFDNTTKVIYSLFPFTIKSLFDDDKNIMHSDSRLEGYHGSTNGIEYNGSRLFLIHSNKERTYHRWILFNPSTNKLNISNEFIFFKHSSVEFTCSLSKFKKRIFISMGINDDKAFILEINSHDIDISFF
jgi:hypothetical protein